MASPNTASAETRSIIERWASVRDIIVFTERFDVPHDPIITTRSARSLHKPYKCMVLAALFARWRAANRKVLQAAAKAALFFVLFTERIDIFFDRQLFCCLILLQLILYVLRYLLFIASYRCKLSLCSLSATFISNFYPYAMPAMRSSRPWVWRSRQR